MKDFPESKYHVLLFVPFASSFEKYFHFELEKTGKRATSPPQMNEELATSCTHNALLMASKTGDFLQRKEEEGTTSEEEGLRWRFVVQKWATLD